VVRQGLLANGFANSSHQPASTARAKMAAASASCRLPRRSSVQLAVGASRALAALASHAIGYADSGLAAHSLGIGVCELTTDRTRPGLIGLLTFCGVSSEPFTGSR
jgi:hypothetical protein